MQHFPAVDTTGAVTVSLISPGSGFVDDETITISDVDLGAGGGADFTFDVNGVTGCRQSSWYLHNFTDDYTTSGSGSGAVFTVVIDAAGAATVTVNEHRRWVH